jgi:hypothetical protein
MQNKVRMKVHKAKDHEKTAKEQPLKIVAIIWDCAHWICEPKLQAAGYWA